jgi:hypothetical protein
LPGQNKPSKVGTAVSFLFGGGMLAIAVWGWRICRAISLPAKDTKAIPLDGPMSTIVFRVSYLVFFGPFICLGVYVLWSALNRVSGNSLRSAVSQLKDFLAGEQQDSFEPLDEQTTRRLNALSTNAAKVLGLVVGSILITLGILGFVAGWIDSHSGSNHLASVRLSLSFATASGLALIVGLIILRDTLRKTDRTWLLPLRIFTAAVSARMASDEVRKRQAIPVLKPPADKEASPSKNDR